MTARRDPARWRRLGVPSGPRSAAVLAVLVTAGLLWLGWPVLDSATSPGRAQSQSEAPWVTAALVLGLVALAAAMWRDAGRRYEALSPVAALIVLDTAVRAVLNPSAGGVEFVHALPLLAGVGAGAPAGFLVGASSAIVSTIAVGAPATTLPAQALIWGLSGMLGGVLWRVPALLAWALALPLALIAGVASGVLLNLMGWAQEPGAALTDFFPGLPAGEVLTRLLDYTRATSLAYDATRGLTTAAIVLVIGYPVLVALRRATGGDIATDPLQGTDQRVELASPRRERSARLDQMWHHPDEGDPSWTRP
jgi:hypothetical protein